MDDINLACGINCGGINLLLKIWNNNFVKYLNYIIIFINKILLVINRL